MPQEICDAYMLFSVSCCCQQKEERQLERAFEVYNFEIGKVGEHLHSLEVGGSYRDVKDNVLPHTQDNGN